MTGLTPAKSSLQKDDSFRFLQDIHFITKDITLTTNSEIAHIKGALSLHLSNKCISVFY